MKKYLMILMALFAVGCTETQKVGFNTVEDARSQVRENVTMIAQSYRRENPQYSQYELYIRGDSTVSTKCPQGDGWATVDIRTKNGQVVTQLMCSTVSLSLGCLEKEDFKTKVYAQEDGHCNTEIPFPLPKLTK